MVRLTLVVTVAVGLGLGIASRPAEAGEDAGVVGLAEPIQWYYGPEYRRSSGYGFGPRSSGSGSYVRGYRSRSLYDRGHVMRGYGRGSRYFDRSDRERHSRR